MHLRLEKLLKTRGDPDRDSHQPLYYSKTSTLLHYNTIVAGKKGPSGYCVVNLR